MNRRRTRLLLKSRENFYCRCRKERGEREESRLNMTSRLNPDYERREGQKCKKGAQEKQGGPRSQENCKNKMTESYRDQAVGREGKFSPWEGEVEGRVQGEKCPEY